VAGPNNSVTLLLDKDNTFTNAKWSSGTTNTYSSSSIVEMLEDFANISLNTTSGIIERTLTGGSSNYSAGGYNEDRVKGSNVDNQKVWPLSADEASHLILSTRIFVGSNLWWLRSPGGLDLYASTIGGTGGFFRLNGDIVGDAYAVRPALYLNITNSVFTGINFDNNNLPIGACTREPTNLGIDFSAETVTGLDTVSQGWKIGPTYAGLGAPVQQASTSTAIDGIITNSTKSLVFVKASDDIDHFDSDKDRNGIAQQSLATTISIPARPSGPSVEGVAPSDLGASDGKITGTSNRMEYSTDEVTWTNVTGTAITGLTSGTYFVRTVADQSASKFKSFAKEVIVKEGSPEPPSKPSSGPSAGPGSGSSTGDGGVSSEGTAQTGVDFATLELLALLMVACGFGFRRKLLR
jgi:hypothetical protein